MLRLSASFYLATLLHMAIAPWADDWFKVNTLSFELVKGLPVFIVAVIALYVAWRQWKTASEAYRVNRAKLRLDLFDKRYAIYEKVWSFLSHRRSNDPPRNVESELSNAIPECYFLFGPEVGDFARHALTQGLQYHRHSYIAATGQAGPEIDQARAAAIEISDWFIAELNGLRDRFAKYMDFSAWH